jgi:hypothetical protein
VEYGQTITVIGNNIEDEEWILFGPLQLPVTSSSSKQISASLPYHPGISAGAYPVSVAHMTSNQKMRVSNALLATLLPTITHVHAHQTNRTLIIHGHLLGGPNDTILIEMVHESGAVFQADITGLAEQTLLEVHIPTQLALAKGVYQIILRVNGAQAPHTPLIDWL